MTAATTLKTTSFKLRPFKDRDYDGLVQLRNLLFPNHPASIEGMQHNDNTRDEKILHKRWVWEENHIILCSAIYSQFAESYHPHKFVIKIYVHPEHQGRGCGAVSYDHIMQELAPFDPIKITCIPTRLL